MPELPPTLFEKRLRWFYNHRCISIILIICVTFLAAAKLVESGVKLTSHLGAFFIQAPSESELNQFEGGVIELENLTKSSSSVNKASGELEIQAIYAPKEGDHYYERHYEIHVANPTSSPLKLLRLVYISQVGYVKGEPSDLSGQELPTSFYRIKYDIGGADKVSIYPPLKIAPGSSVAFRISMIPKSIPKQYIGDHHYLTFSLIDSKNKTYQIIKDEMER